MKSVMVSFLVAAAATLSSGNAHAYTDAEVLDQIDDAFSYDDNPRMSRGAFGLAHRMSGYDNDRFARILGEYAMGHLAIENGTRSRWAVDSIAKYGTTNSLPFLYSCATNPVCGDCAIKSIIAIEGVTSNSMAVVAAFNSSTNTAPRKKFRCLKRLWTVAGGLMHQPLNEIFRFATHFRSRARMTNTPNGWMP